LADGPTAEPAAGSGQLPTGPAPALQNQGQAAFQAGWLMAQLYGPIFNRGGSAEGHLPSVSELPLSGRVGLAVRELDGALATAAKGTDYCPKLDAIKTAAQRQGEWHEGFKDAIGDLHQLLITQLTVHDPRLGRAYGLGRSLCDTAWMPCDPESFQRLLNPYRVAELDSWLAGLPDVLGDEAVTAVRGSLRAWSAWAADPYFSRRKLNWKHDGRSVKLALRRQGAVWRGLLSGEQQPATLLTAEAYVAAADMSLRRAGFLARQVLAHFWYAVVPLLALVGGLVYLSVTYAAGTAKFWGVFVTVAGGSGALVQGVRRGLSSMVRRTGAPLGQAERADALQAGATRLPFGANLDRVRRRLASGNFKRPVAVPHDADTRADTTAETRPQLEAASAPGG
jgi:hypothetical protein